MKLWAITFNTFRENIRDRVMYNILVFAVLMIGTSVVLGKLSIAEAQRITVDVGLASISAFGVLMSIFLGIGLLSKEIEKKTVYTLIAKPVPRHTFILGRFLGLMTTIAVNIGVMAATFALTLFYVRGGGEWPLSVPMAQAIVLIYFELGIITAAAMLFSTFSTPTLSAVFTLSFFVIGRLLEGILQFSRESKSLFFRYAAEALYWIMPNLKNYVMIEGALHGEGLEMGFFLMTMGSGVLTCALLLIAAMMIFQRRDFV